MIRAAALLAAGTLLGAADLPVPPIPPVQPPVDEAAPIPNLALHGPVNADKAKPRVTVEDFRAVRTNVSQGFAPGSRFQSQEDRKMIQTPGLSLRVPLQ